MDTSTVVPNVLNSPAVPLLIELEEAGVTIRLDRDGGLQVGPPERVTSAHLEHIRSLREPLRILAYVIYDEGVQQRRASFAAQIERGSAAIVPALIFLADVPYAPGICFSCGESNRLVTFGRCWRCSLAWRLACRLPVSSDFAVAVDTAKRVA